MPMIEGLPFYPGFTNDEMLQVRCALSEAAILWRDKAVKARDAERDLAVIDAMGRIADRYDAIYDRLTEMQDGVKETKIAS